MRIQSNIQETGTFPIGMKQNEKNNVAPKEGNNIRASDLNMIPDAIADKKEAAKEKAARLLMDQFKKDGKIQTNLDQRREKIAKVIDEAGEAVKELSNIEKDQKQLMEDYGITEDSKEHQDLLLMRKVKQAEIGGSGVRLTEEERELVSQLGEPTEYQERMMGLLDYKDKVSAQKEEASKTAKKEISRLKAIELELLKHDPMLDAQKSAEKIVEASNKELLGMLMDEGKEKIDKDMEQEKEQEKETIRTEQDIHEIKVKQETKNQTVKKIIEDEEDDEPEVNDKYINAMQKIETMFNQIKNDTGLTQDDIKGILVDDFY